MNLTLAYTLALTAYALLALMFLRKALSLWDTGSPVVAYCHAISRGAMVGLGWLSVPLIGFGIAAWFL